MVAFVVASPEGYFCALVIGVMTSLAYRNSSTEGEVSFLSESLNSVNIASEAIMFFVVGLGLNSGSFLMHLAMAFCAWVSIVLVRPILVYLFFHRCHVPPKEKMLLASFSPKGAI